MARLVRVPNSRVGIFAAFERLVEVGVPRGFQKRRRAIERLSAISHLCHYARPPNVDNVALCPKNARIRPVVAHIHLQPNPKPPGVIGATGLFRAGLGLAQGRQEHGSQDRHNRDHHQQFVQSKYPLRSVRFSNLQNVNRFILLTDRTAGVRLLHRTSFR